MTAAIIFGPRNKVAGEVFARLIERKNALAAVVTDDLHVRVDLAVEVLGVGEDEGPEQKSLSFDSFHDRG